MVEIEVKVYRHPSKADKYRAQVKDKPGFWAEGTTADAAIGNLISTRPNLFNIKITRLTSESLPA